MGRIVSRIAVWTVDHLVLFADDVVSASTTAVVLVVGEAQGVVSLRGVVVGAVIRLEV